MVISKDLYTSPALKELSDRLGAAVAASTSPSLRLLGTRAAEPLLGHFKPLASAVGEQVMGDALAAIRLSQAGGTTDVDLHWLRSNPAADAIAFEPALALIPEPPSLQVGREMASLLEVLVEAAVQTSERIEALDAGARAAEESEARHRKVTTVLSIVVLLETLILGVLALLLR